jgi:hypothetical protein
MTEPIGGFDVRFDIGSFAVGSSIELISNVCIVENPTVENTNNEDYPESVLIINKQGSYVSLFYGADKYHLFEGFDYFVSFFSSIRVLFHDEFCTVYIDNAWAYTFSFSYISYPIDLSLEMAYYDGTTASTGTCNISNVDIQELYDWRDAIYIDLDTNTMNAIQSIIQQRPIEIVPKFDGSLQFYYEPSSRSSVPITKIKDYQHTTMDSKTACSDAIVYYSDVNVLSDNQSAKEVGLVTRIYRLSELDHGALKAAAVLQKKSRQSMKRHKVQGRINLALEIGDIGHIEYTAVDTQATISEDFIVENIQLSLANGEFAMIAEGRDNG